MKLIENKIVLYITFIPYVIILCIAVYYGIVGFRWMESWCQGLDGFFGALELIGLVLVATPWGFPILLCLIYQIAYAVHRKSEKRTLKDER